MENSEKAAPVKSRAWMFLVGAFVILAIVGTLTS